MRSRILAATLLAVSLACTNADEEAAIAAAAPWLAHVDEGAYPASYDGAAELFRNQLTSEKWTEAVTAARQPLGKLRSRKLRSAKAMKNIPGAPDGRYVVLSFEASYENKASAIETVTPMLDKDGQWRVSGYYIR